MVSNLPSNAKETKQIAKSCHTNTMLPMFAGVCAFVYVWCVCVCVCVCVCMYLCVCACVCVDSGGL